MRAFKALFKKEIGLFFISPIAYSVISVFLIISGILFFSYTYMYSDISGSTFQNPYYAESLNLSNDLIRPLFVSISIILLLMIPTLTMRLYAEEKRSKTLDLLMSYPVTETQVLLAKFLASLSFFCLMIMLTLFFPLFVYLNGSPETGPIISAYLAYVLLGAFFISLGLFASALTENQIIAALVAFGLNLLFWIIGWILPESDSTVSAVLKYLSLPEHYEPLTKGVINTADLVYFICIPVIFLFFTNRVVVSRRWRG